MKTNLPLLLLSLLLHPTLPFVSITPPPPRLPLSLSSTPATPTSPSDVSTSPDTSLETLLKLPNAVLKERLRDYGVAAQGRKQALAEQLREAMLQSPAASEGAGGDQPNPTTANADLDGITSDSPPTNDPCPPSPPLNAKFSDLPPPLKDYFKTSLSSNSLTPIQQQVFGSYLDQTTVIDSVPFIVHAPTGSGKTLAYVSPKTLFKRTNTGALCEHRCRLYYI